MSSVNTNMGAVVSAANMAKFGRELDTSIERLSSGLRINSAKDDAAGMAIVSKMEAQVRGVTQAIRNATDSQKLIDTSEGAHVETLNILQRMRELAVQSANDTNQAIDRAFLNSEVTQLVAEIDRIANQTTWNGEKILDGNFTSKQFQLGANEGEKVTYSIDSAKSAAIGNYQVTGTSFGVVSTTTSSVVADTLTISGYIGSSTVSVAAASTAAETAALVNAKTASTGVSATAETNVKLSGLVSAGTLSFTLGNGDDTASVSAQIDDKSDLRALRDAINAVAGTTGISAEMSSSSNADVILTHSTGADIIIQDFSNTDTDGDITFTALTTALAASGSAVTVDAVTDAGDDAMAVGQIDFDSHKSFSVSSTSAANASASVGFFGTTASNTASLDAVSAISIGTASGAQSAITVIDGAINKINQSRSNLGAISNRLDSTISNLTNVATNVEGSMSNIKDADFSVETSKLTRAQILTQAATSMLAQANTSKQSILALLQG